RRLVLGVCLSVHFGFCAASSAISVGFLSKVVLPCQCHSFAAHAVSSTIHGISNGRGLGSAAISRGPKHVVHHALNCARDMLFVTPPPRLQIRFLLDGASICCRKIDIRSRGCRQSRT